MVAAVALGAIVARGTRLRRAQHEVRILRALLEERRREHDEIDRALHGLALAVLRHERVREVLRTGSLRVIARRRPCGLALGLGRVAAFILVGIGGRLALVSRRTQLVGADQAAQCLVAQHLHRLLHGRGVEVAHHGDLRILVLGADRVHQRHDAERLQIALIGERLATRLQVHHQQVQLAAVGHGDLRHKRTALEAVLLELRLVRPALLLARIGIGRHALRRVADLHLRMDLDALDRIAAQDRLLHAAVVANLLAGEMLVAEILEVGVTEPGEALLAFHFLKRQHIGIQRLDRRRQTLQSRLVGRHRQVVVLALERGIVLAVEEVLHVVCSQTNRALGLDGRLQKADRRACRAVVRVGHRLRGIRLGGLRPGDRGGKNCQKHGSDAEAVQHRRSV